MANYTGQLTLKGRKTVKEREFLDGNLVEDVAVGFVMTRCRILLFSPCVRL